MKDKFSGWLFVGLLFMLAGCGSSAVEPSPQPTISPTAVSAANTAVPRPTPTAANSFSAVANADVLFVRAVQGEAQSWTFYVTVQHPDTGWDDYADGWDVLLPDGMVVKPDPDSEFTRLLLHPHVDEQPFTRSQSRIIIPADVTQVTVRAHDLVDGFGGREVVVDLTAVSGPDFTVE